MGKEKTYAQMFQEANDAHQTEELTVSFKTFAAEGDMLIGRFLYSEKVQVKEDMEPVNRYVFDTDEGMQSALLGGAADRQFGDKFQTDEVYMIQFRGKIPLDGGARQVNRWEVIHVPTVKQPKED